MAKKVYKRKYTKEDLNKLTDWMKKKGGQLFVEVVDPSWGDGYTTEVNVLYLEQAIRQTEKIYEQEQSSTVEATLMFMDTRSTIYPVYHIDKNHEGIPFEIFDSIKG